MKKFYDDRGKECSRTKFRVIGVLMAVACVSITILVLYLKSFIFSPIIQIIGFFVLTSGYAIPLLLLISQRYTEAGLAPLFNKDEFNMEDESVNEPDLSFTNLNNPKKVEPPPKTKKPVGGSYFRDHYQQNPKRPSSEPKPKRLFWLVAVPYFTMLLVLTCYFLILYSPIRSLINTNSTNNVSEV